MQSLLRSYATQISEPSKRANPHSLCPSLMQQL